MKKLLLYVSVAFCLSNQTKAQWVAWDSANYNAGGIKCIGSAYNDDTLYMFSLANNMFVYDYNAQTLLDSSWNGGLGYPPERIQVNKINRKIIYYLYNGFGNPNWFRRNLDGTTTGIGTAHANDFMQMSPTGVLYYKKNGTQSVKKSINDGTSFTDIFTYSNGSALVGVAADGGVFVNVSAQANGGIVTFDSAGLYKSSDAGVTWTMVYNYNNSDTVRKFSYMDCVSGDCYAIGGVYDNGGADKYDAFFYSNDNGNTWTLKSISNFDMLNKYNWGIDADGNVYYAKSGQIYKSTDKGATFSTYMNGLPNGTFSTTLFSTWGKVFTYDNSHTLYSIHSVSTGIENIQTGVDFNIYPNPATSEINLNVAQSLIGGQVFVTNSLGQIIINQAIDITQLQFSLSDYANGMYFISIRKDAVQKSVKFIKH